MVSYRPKGGLMPTTQQGKAAALAALASRRAANKDRVRVDDSRLPAGSPMHYECRACGEELVVPEHTVTPPKLCGECVALKDCGWLE